MNLVNHLIHFSVIMSIILGHGLVVCGNGPTWRHTEMFGAGPYWSQPTLFSFILFLFSQLYLLFKLVFILLHAFLRMHAKG
jgi:hypothetical protein